MERFYFEIVAASDAAHHVPTLEALVSGHPLLSVVAEAWTRPADPAQSDLYALLVIASDGIASDPGALTKVGVASAGGFPLIPVVADRDTYDFQRAPLPELAERNAEALNDPDRLLRSLLHHAGVQLFEGGGQVFISYARADGDELAEAVRTALGAANIGRTMDVYAFPGGDLIQEDIERRIRQADLVVLIDSQGAARSPWVAEELDIAMAAQVDVIAVTPEHGAFHHAFQAPHVGWRPGVDVADDVVATVRRILARKLAFRVRVERVIHRLARLRDWTVAARGDRWRVQRRTGAAITVGYVPEAPRVEAVVALRNDADPDCGLLVAGVRPLLPITERGLHAAGDGKVAVAPLPAMAAKISAGFASQPLSGCRVFLSAAMPSDPDEVELARLTISKFVVSLAQVLVDLGATLVFGGHPSVSPLVHKAVARLLREGTSGSVELHQARCWMGQRATLSAEVREGPVFRHVKWHGGGADPATDVSALRDGMIRSPLDAAVFVGGKTDGFIGPRPGIVDEYARFAAACPDGPTFAVGLAGGAARTLPDDGSSLAASLRSTADPDLAVALIIAELLRL